MSCLASVRARRIVCMRTSAPDVEPAAQFEQVARSAGAVSIAIAVSRVTGLAREMVMAQKFGAGFSYDAFLLGFRIPNLGRDLFAEGALSSAFVPTFTTVLAKGGKRDAALLANLVGTATILVVGTLCILGVLFAPQLVSLLAPGFALVPRPAFNWSHPALCQIFSLMLPAILGNAAVQINVIVNTSFASALAARCGHDAPVSWLGYALRFVQLPLGLFGVAFAAAMLPSISRSAAASNFDEFRKTVSRSLSLVFLLSVCLASGSARFSRLCAIGSIE